MTKEPEAADSGLLIAQSVPDVDSDGAPLERAVEKQPSHRGHTPRRGLMWKRREDL